MNLLLDSHTIIWFLDGNIQLSDIAKEAIENDLNTKYVSSASLWEIAIKISLKKVQFSINFKEFIKLIDDCGFEILPITSLHSFTVSQLPFHHRDPFDRMIISQAMVDDLSIVSKDEHLKLYKVNLIW